jgi:uncharacterized protein (TIGR02246 family)
MRIPGHLLISLSVLVLVGAPIVACAIAAPNDEEDVRNVLNGFAESWNRHDMHAFGKLFATDADFVNVVGARWKGRQAIQLNHAYAHGTIPVDTPGFESSRAVYGIFKASTLRFTQMDVRFLRKDVAVVHASSELLGDARTTDPRRGVLILVLTRQDGVWLIASGQNTEINRTVR